MSHELNENEQEAYDVLAERIVNLIENDFSTDELIKVTEIMALCAGFIAWFTRSNVPAIYMQASAAAELALRINAGQVPMAIIDKLPPEIRDVIPPELLEKIKDNESANVVKPNPLKEMLKRTVRSNDD